MTITIQEPVAPVVPVTTRDVPSILDPRVERGAALLDERMPGWAEKIELETFVLSDCKRCVIGQLYGHYYNYDELSITGSETVEHGFDVFGQDTTEYPALEQDWRLAILSRRAA